MVKQLSTRLLALYLAFGYTPSPYRWMEESLQKSIIREQKNVCNLYLMTRGVPQLKTQRHPSLNLSLTPFTVRLIRCLLLLLFFLLLLLLILLLLVLLQQLLLLLLTVRRQGHPRMFRMSLPVCPCWWRYLFKITHLRHFLAVICRRRKICLTPVDQAKIILLNLYSLWNCKIWIECRINCWLMFDSRYIWGASISCRQSPNSVHT